MEDMEEHLVKSQSTKLYMFLSSAYFPWYSCFWILNNRKGSKQEKEEREEGRKENNCELPLCQA